MFLLSDELGLVTSVAFYLGVSLQSESFLYICILHKTLCGWAKNLWYQREESTNWRLVRSK